jgi:pSer/pThr/pTyr-binding forkhead associated (FHA) protein
MTYRLVSFAGDQDFELTADHPYVVGRAVTSDIPIFDPTISRRHAELRSVKGGVQLRDLGSSNGTFINGTRVTEGMIEPNDSVTFGKVVFQLKSLDAPGRPITASSPSAGGTIVKQVSVSGGVPAVIVGQSVDAAARDGAGQLKVAGASHTERQARKLSLLLEVSQKLSGELDLDKLLGRVVGTTFRRDERRPGLGAPAPRPATWCPGSPRAAWETRRPSWCPARSRGRRWRNGSPS